VDGLVTGEAVPVDLRLAHFPSRALAFAIDWLIQVVLLIASFVLLATLAGSIDSAYVVGWAIVLVVLILVGYPVAWETLTRGRSPGKYALGLRVVRDDGGAERFRHALLRGMFAVVEIWILYAVPATVCSLLNRRSKRVGDLAAGTVVVRERIPRTHDLWEPQVSPRLVAWAAIADLSHVPDPLALGVRQFLGRANALDGQSRTILAQRFLADVLRHIAPPPPPAYPEEILATVVAERRRREQARQSSYAPAPYAVPGPFVTPTPAPPVIPQVTEGGYQLPS
jgi:uncharacterized RDD family membrane protein YckC